MSRKQANNTPPEQPTREQFMEYAREKGFDARKAGYQWDAWDAGDWCDGKGTPILKWKLKLITFARGPFGVFAGEDKQRRYPAKDTQGPDDEVARHRRLAQEIKRINQEDEEREKRKR